jgi:hypothetical protein
MSVQTCVERDGWAVIPAALQQTEVDAARRTGLRHLGEGGIPFGPGRVQPAAAHQVPSLSWLFTHPSVLAAAHDALATDEIVFTGHCDLHMNHQVSWHKDSGSKALGDPLGAYLPSSTPLEVAFSQPAEVVKVGVYLQRTEGIRSLRVDPGSHHRANFEVLEPTPVALNAGDLVVFDVRITHAGEEPGAAEAPGDRLPRLAAFVTFGRPGPVVSHFARVNMQRQLAQMGTDPAGLRLPESLLDALRQAGVGLAPAALDVAAAEGHGIPNSPASASDDERPAN